MKIKIGFIALLSIAILLACNKEKRYSTKLQKGEVWRVKEVSVNEVNTQLFGYWSISEKKDIYEEIPTLIWVQSNIGSANFEWQFQNKGKNFQLNYSQICDECESSELDSLDFIGYDFTGNYKVERHGRNKMRFTSTNTLGYSGKEVMISIERKP